MAEAAADGPELARGVSLALLPVPLVLQLVAQVAVYLALGGRTGRNASTTVVFYDGATAASIVAAYIVLIVTSFWIASRAGPVRQVLRLRRVPLARSAGLVLGALVATSIAAQLLEPVFHGVRSQGITPTRFPGGIGAGVALAAMLGATALLGPFAEEVYFRGLLCGRLRKYGTAVAVIASGLLFAAAHFEPRAFPVLALLGVALAAIFVRTDSIWPGVAFHVLNNAAALAVAFS